METMYPGKVNSPATTLDGGINDSIQTIDLVDGSVLPDAPNLAVIGTEEDAETILYGTKVANQLTNVTRGFQGTAKAWDSGTTIARTFTEYDYAKLKQNIETLYLAKLFPDIYRRDIRWQLKIPYTTAANRYTIQTPNRLSVDIDGSIYFIETQSDIDLSVEVNWDSIATDYRVAANRAGKDFYIYACQPASGDTPVIKLSVNSTVPSGYTADNSRKIGGFHCLCVAVGTIGGHTLTDFVAGDVLPASIWDLRHRAVCENEGMVYDEKSHTWVDIYLASGTGGSTVSVYGGTISDTRDWMDFVDDGGAIGKMMLTDDEFQLIAAGSNEGTNITGSADPVTTGGHIDTASRRMISDIGCEDCCGALNQWIHESSTYSNMLTAGGYWTNGAICGSRSRPAYPRASTSAYLGCRFGAEPRKAE